MEVTVNYWVARLAAQPKLPCKPRGDGLAPLAAKSDVQTLETSEMLPGHFARPSFGLPRLTFPRLSARK